MARPLTQTAEPNGKTTLDPSLNHGYILIRKQGATETGTSFIIDHHGFGRYGVVLRGRTITAHTAQVSTTRHTV